MRVVETYSHLNAEAFLSLHKGNIYDEVRKAIKGVDALTKDVYRRTRCPSAEQRAPEIKASFHQLLREFGWKPKRCPYFGNGSGKFLKDIAGLPPKTQRQYLIAEGVSKPSISYLQADFVKDRIAIEVQFGKYAFVAFDLFVKHLLFYSGDLIDLGIEVLPMKCMLSDPAGGRRMSTGIAYFEGEVYNILRHGRNSPPVPLLIIGIAP